MKFHKRPKISLRAGSVKIRATAYNYDKIVVRFEVEILGNSTRTFYWKPAEYSLSGTSNKLEMILERMRDTPENDRIV